MIGIIDYGMGNLRSVAKALELLGADVTVTADLSELSTAEKLVLPGVGAFGDGMKNLHSLGLVDFLGTEVLTNKKPLIGICLGMQLLAKEGFERGHHTGLGWIDASVRKFDFSGHHGGNANQVLKVPHVGWNDVKFTDGEQNLNSIFNGLKDGVSFYFVHSYHMICQDKSDVAAICNYGYDFTAAVHRDNIFGTQFHPEKSQDAGLKVLENYINLKI
ncbi:imidazole glycerol phosphate synthase subunit HisH [Candidatus Micrarchaeota archaeon]|nr:imidazole glycerol phosphate synthase subunit HisH [Candidatus Micrarchaeota archaeon]